jgi:hypothetical protein
LIFKVELRKKKAKIEQHRYCHLNKKHFMKESKKFEIMRDQMLNANDAYFKAVEQASFIQSQKGRSQAHLAIYYCFLSKT